MTRESDLDLLTSRGMVEQVSNQAGLQELLAGPGAAIYIGFDPTADSLHVGHLLPIMVLSRLQRAGHKPIIVIGGATGMIGDPSGRSTERQLLTPEMVVQNAQSIRRQLERFVTFEGTNAAQVVDNGDWIRPMSYLEWLREVGKHFTVNYMLAKESVRRRLEDREQGISYTEFSYMLMQAYDFLFLFDHFGCRVQGGGNDQWGNITAGIDLIRKLRGTEVYGITFPLLSTAGGEKFGKSAGTAVWLDSGKTSPYRFYQYWVRTSDLDVERYLNLFTLLGSDAIREVCQEHRKTPERRRAQGLLAEEVTRMVHGETGLQQAVRASEALFGKEIAEASDRDLIDIFAEVPSVIVERSLLSSGLKLVDALVAAGACSSKAEAGRLIQAGGAYVNNKRISSTNSTLGDRNLASESIIVLRTGKKNFFLIRFQ